MSRCYKFKFEGTIDIVLDECVLDDNEDNNKEYASSLALARLAHVDKLEVIGIEDTVTIEVM